VKLAKAVIEEAFYYELKHGYVSHIRVIDHCSIIAAVGDSMHQVPGVSGLFLSALGDASINVLSVAQGCDERNIAAVVHSIDATKALRAVHAAFWLSSLDVSIGIIGTGRVGSALLQTILEQQPLLQSRFNLKLSIRGVMNSKKMMLGEDLSEMLKSKLSIFATTALEKAGQSLYIPPKSPSRLAGKEALNSSGVSVRKSCSNTSLQDLASVLSGDENSSKHGKDGEDMVIDSQLSAFLEHLQCSSTTPHIILIDATTSQEIAKMHPLWMKAGCHVVTANKRAIASSLDLYNQVLSASRRSHRMYMSEVTIGASLPIRTTLNDILCSGDAIHSIVGMMSVSVSMILTDICEEDVPVAGSIAPFADMDDKHIDSIDQSGRSPSRRRSFTDSVRQTYLQGLFEDDVFADLEGSEAAAKLLILARDMGYSLTMEDIEIEPIAKRREIHSWANLTDEFAAEDAFYREKARQAKAKGCTLRYIQRIECSPAAELGKHRYGSVSPLETNRIKASVKLEEVPLDSPHAMVKGALYHFSFHTERYAQNPLIVQGPLSDSVTTASGILGDILRVARSMGAKDRGTDILE
jgi:aspartokinase/homoserine dehydrogenase 1